MPNKITAFSSILRGINRPSNDKLNILSVNFDEKFQFMLSKTSHNFYFAVPPNNRPWNIQKAEIPNNCFLSENNDFLKEIAIDLIICQDRVTHYEFLTNIAIQLGAPIIGVDNYLPTPNLNQFQVQALADRVYNKNVVCSKFTASAWGLDDKDVIVIPKAIDTDLFNGWESGDGKILTNVDWYHNRKDITGFAVWEKLKQQFKMNPIGHSPGLSEHTKNINELLLKYRKASVFLNTSSWLSCPVELLEAMSCGCPIITTKTTDIDFIQHGVNGFCTNNFDEICEKIKLLLSDKVLARTIGEAGRRIIMDKFYQPKFINEWEKIFRSTIDTVCSLLRI